MSAFTELAAQLARKKGVTNPKALAASIGRKKYGPKAMAQAAAKGRPAKMPKGKMPMMPDTDADGA
jgi:hypothetical protein